MTCPTDIDIDIDTEADTMPPDVLPSISVPDLAITIARGREYLGLRVIRITVETDDGQTHVIEKPRPVYDDPEVGQGESIDPESLSMMEERVYAVVKSMRPGEVLKTTDIARRANHSNSGHLREFLKTLDIARVTRQGVERLPD